MAPLCPYCGSEAREPASGASPHTWRCPTCGQELDLPQKPLNGPPELTPALDLPPPPPPEGEDTPAGSGGPAWEDQGVPLLAALWRTTWQVLLHPVRTFRAPAQAGLGPPFSFGLILGTLATAAQGLWSGWRGDDPSLWLILLAPLITALSLFVNAGLIHGALRLVGGARAGFLATFRVMAYANAAGVFNLVPAVGIAVGGVWSLVVTVAGLAAAHGVSRWRPVWALVLLLVVVMGVSILCFLALMGWGALHTLTRKGGALPF